MSYLHKPKAVAAAERDARIARLVMRKLRALGYAVQWCDVRDASKARLHPVNLKIGNAAVLCRALGDIPVGIDAAYLARYTGAYLQLGSSDISSLVSHLERINKPHWNA